MRHFYVKNCVSKGILDHTYISSSENVTVILTKGLNRVQTQYFSKAMEKLVNILPKLVETSDQRGVLRNAKLV